MSDSATPWTTACQASLSFTVSQSLFKLMSIQLVMPYNHLILCDPFLLLPSIFLSIRVFSNEWALGIRWLKYWSFSFTGKYEDASAVHKLRRMNLELYDGSILGLFGKSIMFLASLIGRIF